MMADPRMQRLAILTAAWSAAWTLCLHAVPPGASGRNHIVTLNAAHGVVCTLTAAATIWFSLDSANSVAVSLAFFLVDLAAMLRADGLRKLLRRELHRSRVLDYAHHGIGIFWGLIFFAHESTVCAPSLGNPYVWIQTNEVSTGFYNWYRLTHSRAAGALFAGSFFLSRIAFNSLYFIPRLLRECDRRYLLGCVPFFLLQYVWFALIVRKLARAVKTAAPAARSAPVAGDAIKPPPMRNGERPRSQQFGDGTGAEEEEEAGGGASGKKKLA